MIGSNVDKKFSKIELEILVNELDEYVSPNDNDYTDAEYNDREQIREDLHRYFLQKLERGND